MKKIGLIDLCPNKASVKELEDLFRKKSNSTNDFLRFTKKYEKHIGKRGFDARFVGYQLAFLFISCGGELR